MFRKVLMTGGAVLLTLSAVAATFGIPAFAQEVARAPVPTTPTSSTLSTGTVTTQPATVERSSQDATGVANTGPHDYVAWLSLAGVASVALGVSMRGRRADGSHWR